MKKHSDGHDYHQIGLYTLLPIRDVYEFKRGLGRVLEYYLRDRGLSAHSIIKIDSMEDLQKQQALVNNALGDTPLKGENPVIDNTIYIILHEDVTCDIHGLNFRFKKVIENSSLNGIQVKLSKDWLLTTRSGVVPNKCIGLNIKPGSYLTDKDIMLIMKYITSKNKIIHIDQYYTVSPFYRS